MLHKENYMDMKLFLPFIVGLAIMLFLMLKTKLGPFASMLLGALLIGLGCGVSANDTISAITQGFGNTCRSIGIVIIFGTILGEYLEKSNASQRIALTLLRLTGEKKASVALAGTGYLVSIPVFSDVALVMLSPLAKAVASRAGLRVGALAVALAMALLNTNAFVAPTPAPLSIVAILNVDIGTSILWGLIVALFGTFVSWIYSEYLARKPESWYVRSEAGKEAEANAEAEKHRDVPENDMPSFFNAILPILVPVILIVGNTTFKMILPKESPVLAVSSFLGNSNIALAIGCIVALLLLYRFLPKNESFEAINNAMKSCGPIIFITAAGGALAQVIRIAGVGDMFAKFLIETKMPVIIIPFLICGLSKFAQGSGSVAAIMAATLTVPLIEGGAISPIIAFLSICSGSHFGSHVNNSFFWVFANLFGFDTKTSLKTLAFAQNLNGVACLLATWVLNYFI